MIMMRTGYGCWDATFCDADAPSFTMAIVVMRRIRKSNTCGRVEGQRTLSPLTIKHPFRVGRHRGRGPTFTFRRTVCQLQWQVSGVRRGRNGWAIQRTHRAGFHCFETLFLHAMDGSPQVLSSSRADLRLLCELLCCNHFLVDAHGARWCEYEEKQFVEAVLILENPV